MAEDDTHPGMAKVPRPVHGPRPISAVLPAVARTVFRRTAPSVAHLLEAWAGMVGPGLADLTIPRRLSQGTLTVGCSGPVAMELQHLSTELIGRINQYFGSEVVRRLRLMQTAAANSGIQPIPRATEAATQAASEAVASLPEGPLRDALNNLGRAVLTESTSRLGKQPRTRC